MEWHFLKPVINQPFGKKFLLSTEKLINWLNTESIQYSQ